MPVQSIKEMTVYVKAYDLAMRIFELTKQFPVEERFSLTSQIRRSSRSVCLNLREAWAKRRFELHFISKLTDCDAEINETDSSLDFARDCGFIDAERHRQLGAARGQTRLWRIGDPNIPCQVASPQSLTPFLRATRV